MHQFKSAKIIFCFAVLSLIAKPFMGFSMFNRIALSSRATIYVKAFTKRKQEYVQDSSYDMDAVQRKLAHPVNGLLLNISFLSGIILRFIFPGGIKITNQFLIDTRLSLSPCEHSYILNRKLLI